MSGSGREEFLRGQTVSAGMPGGVWPSAETASQGVAPAAMVA